MLPSRYVGTFPLACLRKIEAIQGMPTKSAVMMWLLQGEEFKAAKEFTNPEVIFVDQYPRARGPG